MVCLHMIHKTFDQMYGMNVPMVYLQRQETLILIFKKPKQSTLVKIQPTYISKQEQLVFQHLPLLEKNLQRHLGSQDNSNNCNDYSNSNNDCRTIQNRVSLFWK